METRNERIARSTMAEIARVRTATVLCQGNGYKTISITPQAAGPYLSDSKTERT